MDFCLGKRIYNIYISLKKEISLSTPLKEVYDASKKIFIEKKYALTEKGYLVEGHKEGLEDLVLEMPFDLPGNVQSLTYLASAKGLIHRNIKVNEEKSLDNKIMVYNAGKDFTLKGIHNLKPIICDSGSANERIMIREHRLDYVVDKGHNLRLVYDCKNGKMMIEEFHINHLMALDNKEIRKINSKKLSLKKFGKIKMPENVDKYKNKMRGITKTAEARMHY